MIPTKSGWQTSEFWLQFIPHIFTLLVMLGMVKPEDASTLQGAIGDIATKVIAIIGSVMVVWKYIDGRIKTKQTAMLAISDSSTATTVSKMNAIQKL